MANTKTLEQKHQEALDKAKRIKIQIDKQLSGQKFVLGGMLMKIAEDDPSRIPQILADMEKHVTRKSDVRRLETFKNYLAISVSNSE